MKQKPPEIVEVNAQQLQELVSRFESATLDEDDRKLICQVLESYVYVTGLLSDKKTSINRLRKLIFGGKTEKTKNVVGDSANGQNDAGQTGTDEATPEEGGSAASPETMDEDPSDDGAGRQPRPRKPGHGRNSAQAYRAADQVEVPHESLAEGDQCPDCGEGTLYEKPPGVVVRIVGQAPLRATVFRLRKLRCHLCGRVFTAAPPENAGGQKYDATAGSMIAMLKYGSGLPFHRLQRLQWCLETPLPASTQWDVVYAFAPQVLPAYEELIRQAAQGDVMHNDDTTVKILELMGERRRENISQEANSSERTGLFTSGVVATCDGHRVALFFSGRQHSGENLGDVLKHRAEELAAPIQMCDALSRNLPKELQTVVANCIAHGRRHFVDMYDLFPEECRYVLESLKVVYHNDAVACQQAMAPEERLQYHQTHSQPTMNELQAWLQRQLDDKLVEPNSALGGAINYMLRHWKKLTLFLRRAGAPLDNNICERALKKAILHRKNSLFYKTQNGANVGDMYMSLIYTCELNGANPFDYMTKLQQHADEVASHPELWMPWNYRQTLEAMQPAA